MSKRKAQYSIRLDWVGCGSEECDDLVLEDVKELAANYDVSVAEHHDTVLRFSSHELPALVKFVCCCYAHPNDPNDALELIKSIVIRW